jgi:hypothetical protein
MPQFSLKRLFISTAIVAIGCIPWAISSPLDRSTAFLGAPLVCGGIGYLLSQTGFATAVGVLMAAAAGAFRIPESTFSFSLRG